LLFQSGSFASIKPNDLILVIQLQTRLHTLYQGPMVMSFLAAQGRQMTCKT
jgi:hypothetical protein